MDVNRCRVCMIVPIIYSRCMPVYIKKYISLCFTKHHLHVIFVSVVSCCQLWVVIMQKLTNPCFLITIIVGHQIASKQAIDHIKSVHIMEHSLLLSSPHAPSLVVWFGVLLCINVTVFKSLFLVDKDALSVSLII